MSPGGSDHFTCIQICGMEAQAPCIKDPISVRTVYVRLWQLLM
jgi:hypothetical protein